MLLTRRSFSLLLLAPSAALAKKKHKDKKKGREDQHLGLISGSVFRSNGLSLPGAKVTAVAEADAKRRIKTTSSPRGEFTVRAPAGPTPQAEHKYRVRVEAKGYQPMEKTVGVWEAQRTSVNFVLSAK